MARRKARRMSKPQPEQNVLLYEMSGTTNYIDLAVGLTAVNRKQYHQTKGMRPLAYHWRAQAIDVDSSIIQIGSAANTWTTKNAVTKLGAMFKQQLRKNNIRISDLHRYGRELRLALEVGAGYSHASGSDGFGQTASYTGLFPATGYVGSTGNIFADYTNSDGTTVARGAANELTQIAVPEATADGEPETVVVSMIGTTSHDNNDLALIPEYLGSRRSQHDHSEAGIDMGDDDNLLNRIGSSAEEHYDDVVEAVEATGDLRPYNEAGANKILTQGVLCNAGDYASGIAPLGLLRLDGTANQELLITVSAITEM